MFCIKDNQGNFLQDKCVYVNKKKVIYVSFKQFGQCVTLWRNESKVEKLMNSIQKKLVKFGFKVQLHIDKIDISEYYKNSQMVIQELKLLN